MRQTDSPEALIANEALAQAPWLRATLAEAEVAVRVAADGEDVLDQVAAGLPDVVLLTTQLAGLDAFEVCRRLAFEPATAHLPVFLVVRSDASAIRLRSLDAGAEDVLSAPMPRDELLLRLRNALRRKRAHDTTVRAEAELRQAVGARDRLLRLVLEDLAAMLEAGLRAVDGVKHHAADRLNAEDRRYLRVAERELLSSGEAVRTLHAMRTLESGAWAFEPRPTDLTDLLAQAVEAARASLGERELSFQASVGPGVRLTADSELLAQGLTALIIHLGVRARPPATIAVTAESGAGSTVELTVVLTGEARPHDARLDPVAEALHLTLARMVAEAHGGSLGSDEAVRRLVLNLPPSPPAGRPWPPSSVFRTDGPAGAGPAPAAATATADILAARASLPAPPRRPRLMPPTRD